MTRRALVTGACGFIGAVLARRLVEDGHDVHLLVKPGTDAWRLEGLEASRHSVDLADREALRETLRDTRPDWIFHLAAHGAYPSQTEWQRMVAVNVVGTMNLVDAALEQGFDAFVNTGSSSEYGFTDHAPTEDERAEPNSPYAVTKLSQTQFCRFVARKHDVHIPTLRLYSVYGPYEEPSRLVPTLIVRGRRGRLPPLVAPDVARDFVYTDDVAEAFLAAAERRDVEHGAVYNVGTGKQTSLEQAVAVAREVLDIPEKPRWQTMPNRTWDTRTWVANPSKIQDELGWRARIPFEDGFRRFATWMSETGAHIDRYT